MNKDLSFEHIEDFADYIVGRTEEDEELFVSVIGKFTEIKNMIKEIIRITEVDFEHLSVESPIMSGYEDEYVLDCWCTDGVIQIGCEPAKRNGEYYNLVGDETYLLEDCSSKLISLCKSSNLYFVNFDEEDCCDDEREGCCSCDCHSGCVEYTKADDGEIHGFTASRSNDDGYRSYSFYTSDTLSMGDVLSILKKFGF